MSADTATVHDTDDVQLNETLSQLSNRAESVSDTVDLATVRDDLAAEPLEGRRPVDDDDDKDVNQSRDRSVDELRERAATFGTHDFVAPFVHRLLRGRFL